MYTYILVGDIGDGTIDPSARRSYAALSQLLESVQQSQRIDSSIKLDHRIRNRVNQFCVPVKTAAAFKNRLTISDYDFSLGLRYRTLVSYLLHRDAELASRMTGKGPFMVATRAPLAELIEGLDGKGRPQRESPILLVDMSQYGEESIPYFMEAFKEAVYKKPPSTSLITSYKSFIVQLLADAGKAVPEVKEFWSRTLRELAS